MNNATKKLLAKLLVLCMIVGMVPVVALSTASASSNDAYYTIGTDTAPVLVENKTDFADVPNYAYYTAAVNWAVTAKITDGMTETSFGPEVDCTMEMIMTFLWKAAGKPEVVNNAVEGATDYAAAVQWAKDVGIIKEGEDFNGGATCTRLAMVRTLWRAAGAPNREGEVPFTDLPADIAADDMTAIIWAVQQGITNGNGSPETFDPNGGCNRAQMITFLYRAYA